MNNKKNYKEIQIFQLKRDIQMIQDILNEKIENYTNQPIPALQNALSDYQNKLKKIVAK